MSVYAMLVYGGYIPKWIQKVFGVRVVTTQVSYFMWDPDPVLL